METFVAELVLDARAVTAEGPVWLQDAKRLCWLDIPQEEVHFFSPHSGGDEVIRVGQPVGAVAPRIGTGLIAAARDGFGLLDLENGTLTMIADVETDRVGNRMNDGKCDRRGRFWAGTMALDPVSAPKAGSLYRLDPDGTVSRILTDVGVSNGLGWSADDRTMYYIDSFAFGVHAFDFDPASGAVSGRRPLIEIPFDRSHPTVPDGMTVDAEGYLWVAVWGASEVRRYAPDGTPVARIELPVTQVTSCTFGGDDLGDLYITTGSHNMSQEQLASQPHAGGLFRCRPGVSGAPAFAFAG